MKYLQPIFVLALLFMFSLNTTIAQNKGMINNGAYLKISNNAILDINGEEANYVHNTTNGIELNGTIKTEGDWINNSGEEVFSVFGDNANFILDGNGGQIISGSSSTNFYDVSLLADTEIQNNVLINGDLQFNGAILQVTDSELRFSETATITGSFDDNNMITTNETGTVVKELNQTGEYELPVGGDFYAPALINITEGTFNNAEFTINVTPQKFADNNSSTDYLNVYWTLNQTGITDMNCDLEFGYDANDVVGSDANIYGLHYYNTTVDQLNIANANTISGTVSEFGTFTGGEQSEVNIDNIDNNFNISVSNGNLIVDSNIELINTDITVYSILGQKILVKKITESYNEIPLNVISGTYLLQINSNGVNYSEKFVLIN